MKNWPANEKTGSWGTSSTTGSAWVPSSPIGDNFIAGYGAGLRLTIPASVMFRLDFAYAKNEFGIKFAIGGAEKAVAQRQRVR